VLIKPFYFFFIDRTVQVVVGPQEYGLYLSIFNFTFIINILLDMGIVNFNNRNIAQDSSFLKENFSSILTLRLLLGLVYILIAFVIAYFLGYDSRQFYLLGILAVNQFLLSFILYLRSNISGLLMFVTDSFLSILDKFLLIIFCSILLYSKMFTGVFKIEWFIYSQTVAYLLTALVALIIVIKKAKFKRLQWNSTFFFKILKQSLPYATLTLLMSFYNRVDSVMLTQMIPGAEGQIQVGIYAHSFRLLEALSNFSYLFAVLLLPMFSKMIAEKEDVKSLVGIAFNILTIFVLSIIAISWFYSYELMDLLYKDDILISAQVCRILMFCLPGMSYGYIFGTLLTANGSLKQLNIIAGICMLFNFVLNLILIPKGQVIGAAITGAATQSLVVIFQLIAIKRTFKFKITKNVIKTLLRILALIAIVVAFGYLTINLDFAWYYKSIIIVALVVIGALMLNMVNVKELIKIIKTNE
jgi:O-antigen/teichoic acid export membrane protein